MRRYLTSLAPVRIVVVGLVVLVGLAGASARRIGLGRLVHAAALVNFIATDDVGPWFQCVGAGCVQAGTQSLAVVNPGTDVRITVGNESGTVHTFTSLVYPTGAQHMPFDQPAAFRAGSRSVTLNNPGLYVFVCKVHPFMLAATIVDDPATPGLDLGENVSLVNGITVPTTSDLATRLLRAFWLITNPANYQDHNVATNPSQKWTINYPAGVPGQALRRRGRRPEKYAGSALRKQPAAGGALQSSAERRWRSLGRHRVREYRPQVEAGHRHRRGRELLENHQEGGPARNQHEQSTQHVDRYRPEADLSDPVVRHQVDGVRPHRPENWSGTSTSAKRRLT